MKKIYITRRIPERGIEMLRGKGHQVDVSKKDGVLTKEELIDALGQEEYDAVLCLLTDKIDNEIFEAAPKAKIFANYAVGFDNINIEEAKKRGVIVTNTPEVLTNTVAEHTFSLMIATAKRIAEADKFVREGKYKGWEPMLLLGVDLYQKTLGIIGLGRIGKRVVYHATRSFDMNVIYYDVSRNEEFEKEYGAQFREKMESVLKEADFVSLHVPLLESTRHLINKETLSLMKQTAILVNTSRGPVVDEKALVEALKNGVIRAAAIDVFENEPNLTPGLTDLDNVILTPHTASATEETRSKMSEVAAQNIIEALEGRTPPNAVT